jgi:hypothetical protein
MIENPLEIVDLCVTLRTGFRNSLAHGLFVLKGKLDRKDTKILAWKEGTRTCVYLEQLLENFKKGMDRYFAELLEPNSKNKKNFEDAFLVYVNHIKAKG